MTPDRPDIAVLKDEFFKKPIQKWKESSDDI